jgi:hypothetical protein
MARISFIICCACGLSGALTMTAQNLPKHPTAQQVIGHQMQQEKIWRAQQLPTSSVLYKYGHSYTRGLSYTYQLKKQNETPLSMPSLNISSTRLMELPGSKQPTLLQSQLSQQKDYYNLWKKQSWWKDPKQAQGSQWLRDFLINSKNKGTPKF